MWVVASWEICKNKFVVNIKCCEVKTWASHPNAFASHPKSLSRTAFLSMVCCTFLTCVLTWVLPSVRSDPQDNQQQAQMKLHSHVWTATDKRVAQFCQWFSAAEEVFIVDTPCNQKFSGAKIHASLNRGLHAFSHIMTKNCFDRKAVPEGTLISTDKILDTTTFITHVFLPLSNKVRGEDKKLLAQWFYKSR